MQRFLPSVGLLAALWTTTAAAEPAVTAAATVDETPVLRRIDVDPGLRLLIEESPRASQVTLCTGFELAWAQSSRESRTRALAELSLRRRATPGFEPQAYLSGSAGVLCETVAPDALPATLRRASERLRPRTLNPEQARELLASWEKGTDLAALAGAGLALGRARALALLGDDASSVSLPSLLAEARGLDPARWAATPMPPNLGQRAVISVVGPVDGTELDIALRATPSVLERRGKIHLGRETASDQKSHQTSERFARFVVPNADSTSLVFAWGIAGAHTDEHDQLELALRVLALRLNQTTERARLAMAATAGTDLEHPRALGYVSIDQRAAGGLELAERLFHAELQRLTASPPTSEELTQVADALVRERTGELGQPGPRAALLAEAELARGSATTIERPRRLAVDSAALAPLIRAQLQRSQLTELLMEPGGHSAPTPAAHAPATPPAPPAPQKAAAAANSPAAAHAGGAPAASGPRPAPAVALPSARPAPSLRPGPSQARAAASPPSAAPSRPAPAPAPEKLTSDGRRLTDYVVRAGESLQVLATRFHIDVHELIVLNQRQLRPGQLRPGEHIVVPAPKRAAEPKRKP